MASNIYTCKTLGACYVDIEISGNFYNNVKVSILEKLCCDLIVGHDLLNKHGFLKMKFSGIADPIEINETGVPTICKVSCSDIEAPSLFEHVSEDIRPIVVPSRKYSQEENEFILSETKSLLDGGVISPSHSPWRSQVVIVTDEYDHHKKRMAIDYSRTINKFTMLDGYPLPNMDEMANKIAKYKIFSTFDLKAAYYQIPIKEEERNFTAFEACGRLYHFNCVPFGVTNGPAVFQRIIDRKIDEHKLPTTFAYLDNVVVAGNSQEEHDANVEKFLDMVEKNNLTLNSEKTISSVTDLKVLGYLISNGTIKPDPDRMKPLKDLPLPHDASSLKRALGLFSYYSKWINQFSDKIQPLTNCSDFPLSTKAQDAFEIIKQDIVNSCVICPNDHDLLVLESDASDFAISACLNQGGKPVAFFSRTLKQHERNHPAIEKEACAIVEAVRKWRHYLSSRKFLLITDQQAVSFMYSNNHCRKIKNDKIQRWRIELSCYEFDIRYRPGPQNVTADCLSRAHCSALSHSRSLHQIHVDLCHPGVTRLYHFVRTRNIPYSLSEIRDTIDQCETCARLKPRFYKPNNPPLIKSTQPFERLSLDFKGPLPRSKNGNTQLLTIVDEYSRFPFAFACRDTESKTLTDRLTQIFAMFGTSGSVHNDRGPSLISKETETFLLDHGVAFTRSSRYNPKGNGQCERYNGIIWQTVQLALDSKGLPLSSWEDVLPEALHSIRTLPCTFTNTSPHERLFNFARRSASGNSLPSWLVSNTKVLMKRHVRKTKYEPLCDKVDLIAVNPTNARVQLESGRQVTVSLRDLAPLPLKQNFESGIEQSVSKPIEFSPITGPHVTDVIDVENRARGETDGLVLESTSDTPSILPVLPSELDTPFPPSQSMDIPSRRYPLREGNKPQFYQAGMS